MLLLHSVVVVDVVVVVVVVTTAAVAVVATVATTAHPLPTPRGHRLSCVAASASSFLGGGTPLATQFGQPPKGSLQYGRTAPTREP